MAGNQANPPGLDPHMHGAFVSVAVYSAMYSTLLSRDEQFTPKPHLAESWDVSPDGTTYTFRIRPGVKFHNGRDVTSEDVRFSLERARNPKLTASGSVAADLVMVDQISTPDARTTKVTLKYPTALFLRALADERAGVIVAKDVVEQNGDLTKVDGGSGPFKLGQFEANNFYELERFDQYFERDRPYVDGIRWRVLPESATRQAALRTGQLDWSIFDKAQWDELANDRAVSRKNYLSGQVHVLYINYQQKPLDDVRVRQALSMSVNRKEFIEKIYGVGEPSGLVAAGHPSGYALKKDELPDYFESPQIERAKKLLADAGYASGFKTRTLVFPGFPLIELGAQLLQQHWKRIGVDLEIQKKELSAAGAEYVAGNWDTFLTFFPFYPDPDGYLYKFFHSTAPARGGVARLKDAELDSLLDKGQRQADGPDRRQTYVGAQRRLLELTPMIPIAADAAYEALSARVQSYEARTGYGFPGVSLGSIFSRLWLSS